MKFTLEMNVDNAAFAEDRAGEVGRCLQQVARNVARGTAPSQAIYDSNGNRIGEWGFEGREPEEESDE